MMINKRLIGEIRQSKKYIALNVVFQWIGLLSNIVLIVSVTELLQKLYEKKLNLQTAFFTAFLVVLVIGVRFICTLISTKMSFASSKSVKGLLREKIYQKLLKLGASYHTKVSTAEVVQIAVEGVDQLDVYFASYLPQFFYSMIAPVTLFAVFSFIDMRVAVVLLLCVPLIPVTIALIQTFAKKLLGKYWDQYTSLGDTFLENLQGLTTLKIYQADELKNRVMNQDAEKFRKITMKVLSMQLNSITIMDLIAYGGSALGIFLAVSGFQKGTISLAGALTIILLSADFFIPMRMLGSFFHMAMNGMAAGDKIFRLLDIEENPPKTLQVQSENSIQMEGVSFSYEKDRQVLTSVDLNFQKGSFTAVVGESGSGKSTMASILTGKNCFYQGSIRFGEEELSDIKEESLRKLITYVSFDSYLFKGTVRDNLKMACPTMDDRSLWEVLDQVQLSEDLKGQKGLDTELTERGFNLSGGQRQRLALARAMIYNTPVYLFDEATSNIDVESEEKILEEIYKLSKEKTVIFITHRLANVQRAQKIYVLDKGEVVEKGNHKELLAKEGLYCDLWKSQAQLENYLQKEAL